MLTARRLIKTWKAFANLTREREKKARKAAKLRRGKAAAAVGDSPGGIRLNLGCGDKLLEGYINVDVAPSRKGFKPDVLSDVRRLAFRDSSVDEALSVHVVEHVYQWEAKELLQEWKRVLKPGGRIIVECPNILHAAKELLEAPEVRSRSSKDGQMSMWVFYGDPSWQDPLMCHRWGYSPGSLKSLLEEVGFTGVRQEPAQFKKREPRDMRITGHKPVN